MFETDIRKESRQGILLHDRRGIEYWKLQLTCTREGCKNKVDMGECLCFDDEKEMINCRDNHGKHCSTKCWYDDSTREYIEKVLKEIKRHNEVWSNEPEMMLVSDNEIELIDDYFDAIADEWDGEGFYDQYDIQECPI